MRGVQGCTLGTGIRRFPAGTGLAGIVQTLVWCVYKPNFRQSVALRRLIAASVSTALDETAVDPAVGLGVADLEPSARRLTKHTQFLALRFDT